MQESKRPNRRQVISAAGVLGAAAVIPGLARAQGAWPNRPVTVICPWGAGGGTDATVRIISSLLEKDLGQPFNVVNRTGGSGVVGHSAIATAPPDGYTLGILTVEIAMLHWQKLTELTPASYTPLALMNEDPPGITVSASAPYQNLKALADAIKASPPGKFKASGTGQGGIWHLALVSWLQSMGLKPNHVAWVPSNGAGPAMQDLAANGLDLVSCSLPESRALVEAGKAKSLAIIANERNPVFANVPTLKEAMGMDLTVSGAWRGIAGPKGLPADVTAKAVASLKKANESKEYRDFMANRGFGVKWADPAGFASFMATSDASMGTAMKSAGLVT